MAAVIVLKKEVMSRGQKNQVPDFLRTRGVKGRNVQASAGGVDCSDVRSCAHRDPVTRVGMTNLASDNSM